MAKRTKLEMTSADMDAMHEAYDSVRSNSKIVKVPKDALWRLLQDHKKLLTIHHGNIEETT